MSRIGKLPVALPAGVTVTTANGVLSVKGPKGDLTKKMPPRVSIECEDGIARVMRANDESTSRAMHGLTRSLLNNMVIGVTAGFTKSLEINGVGYRVALKKEYLIFTLGYSHLIYYEVPAGLEVKVDSTTALTISGMDKDLVGKVAAEIRSFRPPEPYKGKGVKYKDEVIRRKEGKSGKR
jgi:large subunit ribosomal protein L6